MKKALLILSTFCLALSCDYIDEPLAGGSGPVGPCNIPQIQFKGDSIQRNALIEDYTGHRCNNCPRASDAIKDIQTALPGASVPVAVHAGPSNFTAPDPPDYPTEFRTDGGEELRSFFRIDDFGLPTGMVGRKDFTGQGIGHLSLFNEWSSKVSSISSEAAPLAIDIRVGYDSTSRQLCGTATSRYLSNIAEQTFIVFWLCESKIVAPQKMPDQSKNVDYIHNNVFRVALNNTFGQELSPAGGMNGDSFETEFDLTIVSAYKDKNCKLVSFVYSSDNQEVLQAEEIYLRDL
jgi:hypothetical protein